MLPPCLNCSSLSHAARAGEGCKQTNTHGVLVLRAAQATKPHRHAIGGCQPRQPLQLKLARLLLGRRSLRCLCPRLCPLSGKSTSL
jgi:hypothetical protein